MTWVCDYCHSAMNEIEEGRNRYRIECPKCGSYWYVDKHGEIINDAASWSPNDVSCETEDESLSVYDAALIWVSQGKDEDYTFGYTEGALEDALQGKHW